MTTINTRRLAEIDAALNHHGDDCRLHAWGTRSHVDGYALVTLEGRRTTMHRAICETVHGPPPTKRHQAAHTCGNAQCINPRHLRWATPAENSADRATHGTLHVKHRQLRPVARRVVGKLALMHEYPQREIAERFNITTRAVRRAATDVAARRAATDVAA